MARSDKPTFAAFMNAQDHAAWKKEYDAMESRKKRKSGKYNPATGERDYAGSNTLKQKKMKK
jgi:hypothetical protein